MSVKLAVTGGVIAGLLAVGGVSAVVLSQPAPVKSVQFVAPLSTPTATATALVVQPVRVAPVATRPVVVKRTATPARKAVTATPTPVREPVPVARVAPVVKPAPTPTIAPLDPFTEWMKHPTFTCEAGKAPGWLNEQGIPTGCVTF